MTGVLMGHTRGGEKIVRFSQGLNFMPCENVRSAQTHESWRSNRMLFRRKKGWLLLIRKAKGKPGRSSSSFEHCKGQRKEALLQEEQKPQPVATRSSPMCRQNSKSQ